MSHNIHFNVIAFSETWLKPNTLNTEILCNKFSIYRKDRNSIPGICSNGGGVLIAVKSTHFSQELIIPESSDIEFCCVHVKHGSLSLYVTCSYVPPHSNLDVYNKHLVSIDKVFLQLQPMTIFK